MTSPSRSPSNSAASFLHPLFADSLQQDAEKSTDTGFNTFFLARENSVGLKDVPPGTVDPSRYKRPHHKSRSGCTNCRKRRVKCDERLPRCSHCLRRNEECERRAFDDILQNYNPPPDMIQPVLPPPPLLESTSPVVNMLQMKLFHHFETSTRHTLCFGSVWKEALGWSLEHECLMQAVLSVSAKHLAYLCPHEPAYGVAAVSHFAQTLSLFRGAINQKFTAMNIDAFMATSVLIYVQLWTETEFLVSDSEGMPAFDLSKDGIFRLAGGLIEIFKRAGPVMFEKPSSFIADIMHSPRQVLVNAAGLDKKLLVSFHSFFAYEKPLCHEQLSITSAFKCESNAELSNTIESQIPQNESGINAGHEDFVSRLSDLLPFLPEVEGSEFPNVTEQLMPDLSRYAFTFLIMIHVYAEDSISRQDPKGLLLLYHFYRAVRILLPGPQSWWAHKRARLLEALLKEKLYREIQKVSQNI